MNKIERVLFAIISVLFIAGGTWLVHHNHTVAEQEKQLIAEHEAQKPVIKEIKRPDQCDGISARMACSEIHIGNKQYSNCWCDLFDYREYKELKKQYMASPNLFNANNQTCWNINGTKHCGDFTYEDNKSKIEVKNDSTSITLK